MATALPLRFGRIAALTAFSAVTVFGGAAPAFADPPPPPAHSQPASPVTPHDSPGGNEPTGGKSGKDRSWDGSGRWVKPGAPSKPGFICGKCNKTSRHVHTPERQFNCKGAINFFMPQKKSDPRNDVTCPHG
ncbi:hypothetical protein ACGFOU_31285 [Streptomyces sp. NPDC048595]|uniref:hypothetical protein n=1 Tax=Streptomyces sp. NPDC048595 TaxID=3365576 RepID=UPI00371B2632